MTNKSLQVVKNTVSPLLIRVFESRADHSCGSHKPDSRLLLLSARLQFTSPAKEYTRLLAGIKLYCLVTELHVCKQLAQVVEWSEVELVTSQLQVRHLNYYTTSHTMSHH